MKTCNDCGSNRIKNRRVIDEEGDEYYDYQSCVDCGSENISGEEDD